jgi:hypothetical protein
VVKTEVWIEISIVLPVIWVRVQFWCSGIGTGSWVSTDCKRKAYWIIRQCDATAQNRNIFGVLVRRNLLSDCGISWFSTVLGQMHGLYFKVRHGRFLPNLFRIIALSYYYHKHYWTILLDVGCSCSSINENFVSM